MSEYQYYEFHAIDRPLTQEQMQEAESLSSRAHVTNRTAIYWYNYSSLPADPEKLLLDSFDMMLYMANWGSRQLLLRLPAALADVTALQAFAMPYAIEIKPHPEYVVLNLNLDDDSGEMSGWAQGEGYLPRMLSIRQDVLEGNYTALYLVWLANINTYMVGQATIEDVVEHLQEFEGGDEWLQRLEPPVPPNLNKFNAAYETLIDFFGLEEDLLQAAAAVSPSQVAPQLDVDSALAKLDPTEKDTWLKRLVQDEAALRFKLIKHLQSLLPQPEAATTGPERRTVRELLQQLEVARSERLRKEFRRQEEASKLKAEQRKRYLEGLVDRQETLWQKVRDNIALKQVKHYDTAVGILVDLRDLAGMQSTQADFDERIAQIIKDYPTLRGLHNRLRDAGLYVDPS